MVFGLPGNLLASVGCVTAAASGWRRKRIPGWAALLLGVGGFFGIALAEFGASVLLGCYWRWYSRWMQREVADVEVRRDVAVTDSTPAN